MPSIEDLPFILIGDSGQRDPEIYAEIVREHPGRVLAIYLRNVSDAARREGIEALAQEVVAAGSTLLLAVDTHAMAVHAAERGFIPSSAVAAVLGEKAAEQAPERHPTRTLKEAGRRTEQTAEKAAEARPAGEEETPNVVVEAGDKGRETTSGHG